MAPERFVTYKEMIESQNGVKKDIDKRVDKLGEKIDTVDERVDEINEILLPLTVAMTQTADNTKEMSESLKEFTKGQRETNSFFTQELNTQAMAIQKVENVTQGITDKKKYNATVLVAILGLIGVIMTGLFQLAPIIFGG